MSPYLIKGTKKFNLRMSFSYHKSLLLVLSFLILGGVMSSCTDDAISEPTDNNGTKVPQEGYYLNLKVNLDALTRGAGEGDFEKYDNYIDPTNLNVLFFYGDENVTEGAIPNTLIKKFSSQEVSLIPVNQDGSNFSNEWYISILITPELENFADKIRKNDFKIAVTANWPNLTIAEESEEESGDNIQILHHQPAPSGHGTDKYLSEKTYYGFLFGNNKTLGTYTNWVLLRTNDVNDAESFIRDDYGPGINEDDSKNPKNENGIRKYGELWWKWNFDDAWNYIPEETSDDETETEENPEEESSEDPGFVNAWAQKNYEELYEWFWKKQDDDNWIRISDKDVLDDFGDLDTGYFKFINASDDSKTKSTIKADGEKVGILLQPGDKDNNVIRVKMPNNGKLTITYGAYDGDATIKCEARNHEDDSTPKSNSNSKATFDISVNSTVDYTSTSSSDEIKITGDAEYLFIYAQNNPVIIYEIEYISSYYIKNIDNIGITPDQINIPMYGIQNFTKLGDLWKKGTTFDLSDFNKQGTYNHGDETVTPYTYKNISLLRSVAKVELMIPKSFKAHHVFLRCMNRRARCEPVDVSTPTNEIWETGNSSLSNHDADCLDWKKIYGHTPFFKSSGSSSIDGYKSKLAWYYGTWADNGKVGGAEGVTPDASDTRINGDDKYPHIMNAMIERTDFTEFTYTGEVMNGITYDRYVLYVPDKYVDDPGSLGNNMETTTPKVCHVEFRGGDDPFTNIDDNNCYRIYFTEGGYYPQGNHYPTFGKIKDSNNKEIDDTWENTYEQNVENLKHHWPIIRNHYYRFTLMDPQSRYAKAKLEILPWRELGNHEFSW